MQIQTLFDDFTGADVSYKNTNGDTVLMKACEKGNEDIMGKLLAEFTQKDILASLTAQNKDGNTCLMKACATGNLKVSYAAPYYYYISFYVYYIL